MIILLLIFSPIIIGMAWFTLNLVAALIGIVLGETIVFFRDHILSLVNKIYSLETYFYDEI